MQIRIEKAICQNLEQASGKEWLETNGIGGFAAATVVGMNTRRYHGLLVPATHPPLGRFVAVSSLQETVRIGRASTELGCNRYAGAVHPQGYRYLNHFRLDPYPVFTYRIGDLELEKQVFMVHGENTTVVLYGPVSHPLTLEVSPLLAYRDYHQLTRHNPHINGASDIRDGIVRFDPYADMPPLFIAHNADEFSADGIWYYNFEYAVEIHRGLDCHEDLFSPGTFRFRLEAGESARLILSMQPKVIDETEAMRESEIARRRTVASSVPHDRFTASLAQAADAFVVKRRDGLSTVIAGYPWFSDWGRDTMISLPGLTLVTGRFAEARDILEAFARSCDQGMIPNRFPDYGEQADYNSVDATLWYVHAVDRYLAYTGDLDFVRERLWAVLTDILHWYRKGARYGIRMDDDGLICAGQPGVQLTWMDAKVGDWVVTPRMGKPVEINALWYNALCVMKSLAETFDDPDRAVAYGDLALRARRSFARAFWNADTGCLYDYIDGGYRDPAVRPNQIFALSLPHRMLPEDLERRILETVEHDLLTPLGLRSLAPENSAYVGRYGGDQTARDGAYHQGTVWGWLIGPFVTAWVRLHGATPESRQEAMKFLQPFQHHLHDAGLGQISEIFDGNPPHEPRGCFAQAWSVAEVLRAYVEDILGRGPV